MIARQGNSWIVILGKTPDRNASVQTFNSRKSAIMFIGNSDLAESDHRAKRKAREWRAANPDRTKWYAKTAREKIKRRLGKVTT